MKDTTTPEPTNTGPAPPVDSSTPPPSSPGPTDPKPAPPVDISTPPLSPKANATFTSYAEPFGFPVDEDGNELLEAEGEDEFPIETMTVVSPEEIPEEWIYPLRLTLEELFTGINLRFRITRHLLSGKKKSEGIRTFTSFSFAFCSVLIAIDDYLGIDVQPGWRAVSLHVCLYCNSVVSDFTNV